MKKSAERDLKLKSLAKSESVATEFEIRQFSHLAFAATLTGAAFFGIQNTAQADELIGNLPDGVTVTPTLDEQDAGINSAYYVDIDGAIYLKSNVVSEPNFYIDDDQSDVNYVGHHVNQTDNPLYVYCYSMGYGHVGDIVGDFINNSSNEGGAIKLYAGNQGEKKNIKQVIGDFINNTASDYGGAIHIYDGSIGNISGNFINNSSYYGGAIHNEYGTIDNISGNFINNTADYEGGAIDNYGTIDNISGNFINNSSFYNGGAIYNSESIGNISGNFTNNTSDNEGGAIYNYGSIDNISGNFSNNTGNEYGGAIINFATIESIKADFTDNHVYGCSYGYGGAISNNGTIINISGNFINNTANIGGGAIYTASDITLLADNEEYVIQGNRVGSEDEPDDNAIYLEYDTKLTFNLKNNGAYKLYDNVRGRADYKVDLTGDGTGTLYLFNDLHDANLSMGNVNLNTINNDVHVYNVNSFTLDSDANMMVDVDLENAVMDRFTANEYTINNNAKLHIAGMNMLSDAVQDVTEIYFAQQGLKDHVVSDISEIPNTVYQTTAYTPIYKYNVVYDNRSDAGYFVFTKGNIVPDIEPDDDGGGDNENPTDPDITPIPSGGKIPTHDSGNPSDAFNPAVLANPVTSQSAGMTTLSYAFDYAFAHSDGFMAQSQPERFAQIYGDRVALSTDYNENLGHIDIDHMNKALWVKPYTSFESIPLKHGPKVDSISYGTILGGDSAIRKMKHGWARVTTAYMGYNGSQLKYDGVDASTNGGMLGITETFYKGNFFTAITAAAGAGVAETHSMYGKDDSAFLLAGVSNKTGYNFEFKGGKFIIQPLLQTSYSMVKSFDYTNAAGVKIKSDAAHNLQIAPTLKFIGNFENGWQPYATVGMVWDALHESNTTANGVKLPEMYTKPYVQYGVGIQRCWADKFSAYGQALVRNGGRRGIALTFGFRWTIGKHAHELTSIPAKTIKSAKSPKVNSSQNKKLVIKSIK